MSYAPHVRPSGDMKSTYLNYNPSDEVLNLFFLFLDIFNILSKTFQIGEIRLENLWFQNRNKAV